MPSESDETLPVDFDLRAFQARNNAYIPVSPTDSIYNDSERHSTTTDHPDSFPATTNTQSIPIPETIETQPAEASEKTKYPLQSRRLTLLSTWWWWWWEIGAIILCIVCIGLVIGVLQRIEDQPIELWPYAIRPNSLISVLTTIAKAAMLIPIASCLSQAKWSHFQRRPHALDHLQLYDDASRGPWGSFLLLFSWRLKAVAAWALAFVTLVALGIEPSVQQILEPRNRQAPLANATAQIGRAENYTSRAIWSSSIQGYGGPRDPNPHILELQTALANGLVGSVPDVNFQCPEPATQCTWEQFSTLAVCANFRNVTNDVKEHQLNSTLYSYTFPKGSNITMDVNRNNGGTTLFHSVGLLNTIYNGTILNGIGMENATDPYNTQRLFFSIELNWCLRNYEKVVASPAGIKDAPYTSEPLYHYDFSLSDTIVGAGIFKYEPYQADSAQTLFNISISLRNGLWIFVNELFSRELHSPLTDDEQFESDTKFGEFLYYANLANFTKNLEETLTNQIRSSSPGDNEEAVIFPGQAFFQETYWHVEWPWITVPIGEAFLTLLLLVISIVATWHQPLFRSSALALLFHGLEESNLEMQSPHTRADPDNLERLAKGVYVEFRENEQGVLKFVRAVKSDAV
ncbi:hypothetical protein F4820DRAFT_442424 [Hypoxylon rubiginosum]|uniref:Uncharacterized protein n=1 Tax=Hypoxylon rubiginosum TaxID=110542 RepID=A0ACB9ZHR1_9PEZI|nr:hypothetical protein F4820DRAFT_442424 [Hypoxylon rubiginosum]